MNYFVVQLDNKYNVVYINNRDNNNKTQKTMKNLAPKNTVKSEFLIKTDKFYIYKSVTPYNKKQDNIDYVVSGTNGDEFGRFSTAEKAMKKFNKVING